MRTATKTSTQNDPDVLFDITSTEKQHSFDVIKTSQDGVIVGKRTELWSKTELSLYVSDRNTESTLC